MDFQPGDVVRLKSGGPNMTVRFRRKDNADDYTCVWFGDKEGKEEPKQAIFSTETLEKIR